MHRLTYPLGVLLLGIAVACSGAQAQDVLSDQIGGAATSGATSGQTSGTTSGGTSGQTSGDPGTSGGTTSSGSPGVCTVEGDDSTEKSPISLTTCATGQFRFPRDRSDFLRYNRPKNSSFEIKVSGPVLVRIFDEDGNEYDIKHVPNNEGSYLVQLDYDFDNHPLSGEDLKKQLVFDWSISISFS